MNEAMTECTGGNEAKVKRADYPLAYLLRLYTETLGFVPVKGLYLVVITILGGERIRVILVTSQLVYKVYNLFAYAIIRFFIN